jgi:large subunit ribosomal protein L25
MADRKEITVKGRVREGRGKNDARRVRAQGFVPVTVYGGGGEPTAAVLPLKDLAAILRSESGRNTIFTVELEGAGSSEVIFHDRQLDPIRSRLVHADLVRLVRGQKIEVTVPIHLVGEPVGVREEDGLLEHVLHELEIRAEPRNIPDSIDVDVTNLHAHDVIHGSDITPPEGVEILNTPDVVVATVGVIRGEVVEQPIEEESAEPEVINKGKKDDE